MSGDLCDRDRKEYLESRSSYDQHQLEVSGRFDNWVMTIAGGALALSLTLVKEIAEPPVRYLWLLVGAWAGLAFALLAGLGSQLTSATAIEAYRNKMDDAYSQGDWTKTGGTGWAQATRLLNWTATLLTMLGVVALCVFSGLNLIHRGAP